MLPPWNSPGLLSFRCRFVVVSWRGRSASLPPRLEFGDASERVAIGLAGADSQGVVDRRDEDLAVADLPGTRVRGNDLDRLLGDVGGDRDFDSELGQEVHDIFGAAIDFGVALLAAVALDLGHRHAVDADGRERLTYLVKLEGFDDRDDEFHGQAFISLDYFLSTRQADRRAAHCQPKSGIFLGKWHKKVAVEGENIWSW